jgi:hypothetical protein
MEMHMKNLTLIAAALMLAACSSTDVKPAQKAGSSTKGAYKLTSAEKFGDALRLTFATDWSSIQCSAAIDGLKVGSGMGNSLAGVAKVSIYVPSKYNARPAGDFVFECSRF